MVHTLTLKTCRRTEQYRDEGRINAAEARHLFRVAAGLESPLLGETAILGQVRRAYDEARAQGKLSANMNKMFQAAIHVGHRVRTETTISRGAVSYSQVTVDMLSRMVPNLDEKVVSIIGVNDMTESILNFLTARGATNLILANRSLDAAEQLARKYDALAVPLSDKRKILRLSDVVISATAAPHSIIRKEDVVPFYGNMLFFDLASPRDIDEDVAQLSGVQLFTLDEIERNAKQNLKARSKAIGDCERIIEEELAELKRWEERRSVLSSQLKVVIVAEGVS
ncbi:MAG: glutamyl-tRNA reductase [Prevotella sp.]|nr:glutamyl-tRNA reductase [Prevotella sp.]